jgi:inner membrane protein involved in colicin E2 resistance
MDYALLMGNIGLVIILALVMYFSRKVNWHKEEIPNTPTPLRPVE